MAQGYTTIQDLVLWCIFVGIMSPLFVIFVVIRSVKSMMEPTYKQRQHWRRLVIYHLSKTDDGLTGEQLAALMPGIRQRQLGNLLAGMVPDWLSTAATHAAIGPPLHDTEPKVIPFTELQYTLTDAGRDALSQSTTHRILGLPKPAEPSD